MASENNLWQSTRPRLLGAGFFVQRIETSTGEGVPDLWVGWDTGYAWLEMKHVKTWPVRATTRVFGADGLSKEQIAWHVAARQRGVVAFIWCGVGKGAARQTFLVPCTEAERFNDMTKVELMVWECSLNRLPTVLKIEGIQKSKTVKCGKGNT